MSHPRIRRDDEWLAALFRRNGGAIRAFALRRVPADVVDDVVSEVFAAAWKHRDALPEPELPWLYRTAVHITLHEHRARRRQAALNERLMSLELPDQGRPDVAVETVDRLVAAALVHQMLSNLSARDAEVLRLWAWEQLSPQEIGHALGCTAVAARVRLHRAKRRAEQLLKLHIRTQTPSHTIRQDLPKEHR